ncbi:MAG TPA: trypsin-like serine protease [Kofleriaceae bacterium]|jgi:secreted trypsin-like serine protease|nr:trypsin-like serine protease [Kofleriaceae bacterium]
MRIALIFAAGCSISPALGTTESAIRGGATDNGDPAVVALSVLGLYSYCSATLIAPHTLLTAGHCNIDGAEAEFGTNADSPSQSIDVSKVVAHPMYTSEGQPYDFALMKLAQDPIGITPVILNGAPLAAANVGQTIRHVGFGVTDDSTGDGGGTRRTVSYSLNTIDAVLIYSGAPGEQTCTGDSGGPGFMTLDGQTEALVGVVSDGPNCDLSEDGWDDRVDVVEDWIVSTVSAWDAPPTFDNGSAIDGGSGSGVTTPPVDAGIAPDAPIEAESGTQAGGCAATSGSGWLLALLLSARRFRRASRRSR